MRRKIAAGVAAFVLATVAIGLWRIGTMTLTACQALATDSEASNLRVPEAFSLSYGLARERFLQAVRTAGGNIESIQTPQGGLNGEPLFLDVALFGAEDAKRALVVSSGTHGIEGFAGSGIQTGLLMEGFGSRLPTGVSLLVIHAINPHGMAHLRRVTEDNVDLNRNFRDHTKPRPRNLPYETIADVISPKSLSFWSEVVSWSRLLWFRVSAGKSASQAAISAGQYSHPDGLFFGGVSDTWSNRTVRSIFRRYLSGANEVIAVDIHTGLGAFGAAEVILNVPKDSPEFDRASAIWGPTLVKTTTVGESVSTHLDASLKLAIPEILPDAEVTAVSLEFGTVPPMVAFTALRAENWLYHNGGMSHPKARELKTCLLRAFHPDSNEWEASVWHQGRQIIRRALTALAS